MGVGASFSCHRAVSMLAPMPIVFFCWFSHSTQRLSRRTCSSLPPPSDRLICSPTQRLSRPTHVHRTTRAQTRRQRPRCPHPPAFPLLGCDKPIVIHSPHYFQSRTQKLRPRTSIAVRCGVAGNAKHRDRGAGSEFFVVGRCRVPNGN